MPERITDAARRDRLASRHLLAPSARASTPEEVADALVGLHSSDPATVFLSAALRLRAGGVADVERALYEERTVVRHHAMRRTIWVMTPDVARHANAGFTRKIAAAERRRTPELFGRDEDWFDDAVERCVAVVDAAAGPIGTREVGAALPDLTEPLTVNAGKRYETKLTPHSRALLQAAFEGRIVRTRPAGSWIGSQYAWTSNSNWLDIDWSEPDQATGAAEIVRRWLDRFGPGTFDDLVWWTGATKTVVRRALEAVAAAEVELDDGDVGYVVPGDTDPTAPTEPTDAWVALLPALDPTPMGWKRRDWYLDEATAARVTDRNGNVGPTVWADGRIVGGWAQRPDGAIAHDVPAESLDDEHDALLATEIARVQGLLGDTRISVRFPPPNQRSLLE